VPANEGAIAPEPSRDDAFTLVALGTVAFILADVAHEGLGHGLATLAAGGTPVMLTTCYFSSSGSLSRWIPAAGGIANGVVGLLSLAALRLLSKAGPHLRYFLTLSIAFNLFFAAAYPAYSGIALFGDWAAVISGLNPAWFWRVLLVAFSAVSYYLSLRLLGREMRMFCPEADAKGLKRLRRMTLTPYLAALAVAALGGALNPAGWTVIFTAAIPGAAAAFGLTQMDHFLSFQEQKPSATVGIITRSAGWIFAAALTLALFAALLGPGIKFSRAL